MFLEVFCTDNVIMQGQFRLVLYNLCFRICHFVLMQIHVYNDAVTNTKAEVTIPAKTVMQNNYFISPSNL